MSNAGLARLLAELYPRPPRGLFRARHTLLLHAASAYVCDTLSITGEPMRGPVRIVHLEVLPPLLYARPAQQHARRWLPDPALQGTL